MLILKYAADFTTCLGIHAATPTQCMCPSVLAMVALCNVKDKRCLICPCPVHCVPPESDFAQPSVSFWKPTVCWAIILLHEGFAYFSLHKFLAACAYCSLPCAVFLWAGRKRNDIGDTAALLPSSRPQYRVLCWEVGSVLVLLGFLQECRPCVDRRTFLSALLLSVTWLSQQGQFFNPCTVSFGDFSC